MTNCITRTAHWLTLKAQKQDARESYAAARGSIRPIPAGLQHVVIIHPIIPIPILAFGL